jgi:hypothetical protein
LTLPQGDAITFINICHIIDCIFHNGGRKVEAVHHRLDQAFEWDVLAIMWQNTVICHGVCSGLVLPVRRWKTTKWSQEVFSNPLRRFVPLTEIRAWCARVCLAWGNIRGPNTSMPCLARLDHGALLLLRGKDVA